MFNCSKCGAKINESDKFCANCGNSLDTVNENNVSKNETGEQIMQKSKNSNIPLIIFATLCVIILCLVLLVYSFADKEKFSQYQIFKYSPHGIYVYNISKDQLDIDKFIKYAEKLPKSDANTLSVFVLDHDLEDKTEYAIDFLTNHSEYNMPMYTNDIIWKQFPYFYYQNTFDIVQSYCTIEGGLQRYHERNQSALRNEKGFTYKNSLGYRSMFGMSTLSGCSQSYSFQDYSTFVLENNLLQIYYNLVGKPLRKQ